MFRQLMNARPAATVAALFLATLAFAPAEAGQWRRSPSVERLCGTVVRRDTFVAGTREQIRRDCSIEVAAGGRLLLRNVEVDAGGRTFGIELTGGGALEARRTKVLAEYITVAGGERRGGPVRLDGVTLYSNLGASVVSWGDVTVARSSLSAGPSTVGIGSRGGSVDVSDTAMSCRDGTGIGAARSLSVRWSSLGGAYGNTVWAAGPAADIVLVGVSTGRLAITGDAAPASITIAGSVFDDGRGLPDPVSFLTPPPARCVAAGNEPEVACPWDPEELPDRESGPRVTP